MGDICVNVDRVSKRYRIGSNSQRYGRLSDSLSRTIRSPIAAVRKGLASKTYFWALREVSLEIREGEVLGIIGRNGAGKTTLLKILSRITEPTEGTAELKGRVGSLLEVGTGFHPELTGRENIFLNGAILGMRKAEIRRKFDEIVAFAEVEKFLDTPVKRYSSGMYVRLAFSVAAHLEPEILLVDEVLAVGDAAFQRKCLGLMSQVGRSGRTVVFVSHNMAAVARLCERGILIDNGEIIEDGPIETTLQKYQASGQKGEFQQTDAFNNRTGTGLVRFRSVRALNDADSSVVSSGESLLVRMEMDFASPIRASAVTIGIGINGHFGERLCTLLNRFDKDSNWDETLADLTTVTCRVARLLLSPGSYSLSFYVDIAGEVADRLVDAMRFEVEQADFFGTGTMPSSTQGALLMDQKWEYERNANY